MSSSNRVQILLYFYEIRGSSQSLFKVPRSKLFMFCEIFKIYKEDTYRMRLNIVVMVWSHHFSEIFLIHFWFLLELLYMWIEQRLVFSEWFYTFWEMKCELGQNEINSAIFSFSSYQYDLQCVELHVSYNEHITVHFLLFIWKTHEKVIVFKRDTNFYCKKCSNKYTNRRVPGLVET